MCTVQWQLVALKVPEARTQCPPIIVFNTPVGFGERDTHLWASILQKFCPFRERSFPPLASVRTTFCFNRKLCQVPTFSHHVGAALSILGIFSSIAIGIRMQ